MDQEEDEEEQKKQQKKQQKKEKKKQKKQKQKQKKQQKKQQEQEQQQQQQQQPYQHDDDVDVDADDDNDDDDDDDNDWIDDGDNDDDSSLIACMLDDNDDDEEEQQRRKGEWWFDHDRSCDVCQRENCTTRCSRCGMHYYCSVECQRYDWKKGGHQESCEAGAYTFLKELYAERNAEMNAWEEDAKRKRQEKQRATAAAAQERQHEGEDEDEDAFDHDRLCEMCEQECATSCSRCRLVYYCSVDCQRQDWKEGHRKICKPRPKKKKAPSGLDSMSALPDEILARIGITVAKLCGAREFVRLSRVSKRLKKVLLDSKSEEMIPEIIRIRSSFIDHSAMLLPSFSSLPIKIHTLEQLGFYERVVGHTPLPYGETYHNLLEENRCHFEPGRRDFCRYSSGHSNDLIMAVQRILRNHPRSFVLLDAHCGTNESDIFYDIDAQTFSQCRGEYVQTCIVGDGAGFIGGIEMTKMRVMVRQWGKEVAKRARQSPHPYGEIAEEKGWVEVFVGLPEGKELIDSDLLLILPPRPDFYAPNLDANYFDGNY